MGEFKVHRVRFFEYLPSAIRALAFNKDSERMAVARTDGAVEIFNFSDNYFQEKVSESRSPRSAVFNSVLFKAVYFGRIFFIIMTTFANIKRHPYKKRKLHFLNLCFPNQK